VPLNGAAASKKDARNGSRHIVATYDYPDANGTLLFQTVRYDPKDFRQRHPDGRGGWIWNLQGIELVLYNLPALHKAVATGQTIFLPEGEKDVNTLCGLGLAATCSPMGAGKWRESYSEALRGATAQARRMPSKWRRAYTGQLRV
jgi:putative DNA primase/helicase